MSEGGILSSAPLVKPWGRRNLSLACADCGNERVGEIWFDTPPPLANILAKYLFTEEALSVQVHPTAAHSPTGSGKDECWLVTEAQPGARLAVGFRERVAPEAIREGALDGSIMSMLNWFEVRANDFFYVPSGTVHSLGAGLTLVEIQQNIDITHRLYDYGRDRALHLDKAMASVLPAPHPPELRQRIDPSGERVLVEGPYFTLVQCIGVPSDRLLAKVPGTVQIFAARR